MKVILDAHTKKRCMTYTDDPIIIELDPVSLIPDEALLLLAKIMAWSTHIEAGLFRLYLHATKGDLIQRRREFYESAKGMKMRIKRVREAFGKQADADIAKVVTMILDECAVVADLRNEWGHNPLLPFGQDKQLHQWEIGSGEFAGIMRPVDVPLMKSLLPHLHQLHINISNLAALLHGTDASNHALVFGPDTPETDAKVKELRASLEAERGNEGPA